MAVSVVSFSFSRAAQPESHGPLCWVMAFSIASYQHLLWTPNSIGIPEDPFGRVWLSLLHLDSFRLELELATWLPSWQRYIIVQRPPDLWNNCHAVHRSLSSGASVYECTMGIFLARPISSANFRPRDFLS